MSYETDNMAVFLVFLSAFLALVAAVAYFGLKQDWLAFVLGGIAVYLVGCIKINGKSIHG